MATSIMESSGSFVVKSWNHIPGAVRIFVSQLSWRPTRRLNSYAIATINGSIASRESIRKNVLLIGKIELKTAETRIEMMITTNRKLVPQRGWSLVCGRTFSTVSGSCAS